MTSRLRSQTSRFPRSEVGGIGTVESEMFRQVRLDLLALNTRAFAGTLVNRFESARHSLRPYRKSGPACYLRRFETGMSNTLASLTRVEILKSLDPVSIAPTKERPM